MLQAHFIARAYALIVVCERFALKPPPATPAAAARRIAATRGTEEILE